MGALRWLDDSGLALYFLNKLKDTNRTNSVPASIMLRLEQNFTANQQRVSDLGRQFAFLNKKFDQAGIQYAVLKGFSLVPQFCTDSNLRHQSDFDYLIGEQSLRAAQQVLAGCGYEPKRSLSRQEFGFVLPGTAEPTRGCDQYFAETTHEVELHLDIWDSVLHGLPSMPKLFLVERATIQHWRGFRFPALSDEDAFLLQVLHASQHLFTYWIRMSCFFEIAYFFRRRSSDACLWDRIEQRVDDNVILREFVVVVSELAAGLFATDTPPLIRAWGSTIRPASRVWIENYGRQWAFSEVPNHRFSLFPTSKLVLFLHEQYRDACVQTEVVRKRMLPTSRFSRMAKSIRHDPSLLVSADWWNQQALIQRSLFHALAGLRYLCEIPRWRRLNRTPMQGAETIEPLG